MTTTKTEWTIVERVLLCDAVRTVYLWGPPGIGKTYSAYNTKRREGEVYAVTLTEETPAAELRGHFVPRGGNFEWHDGPFTRAMREGARLVINELSHASDDVKHILYPVLESSETARLTLPTNETVEAAEGFHVICTDNVSPMGLPDALIDRFDCTLNIATPHPSALKRLSTCAKGGDSARAMLVTLFTQEDPDNRVTMRQMFSIERLLKAGFDASEACTLALGDSRRSTRAIEALGINGIKLEAAK